MMVGMCYLGILECFVSAGECGLNGLGRRVNLTDPLIRAQSRARMRFSARHDIQLQ